jgi:hypothetical protein
MADPLDWLPSRQSVCARYRVRLLVQPSPTSEGIVHVERGEPRLLAWSRIRRALAAEIGEPEGVRTIVFDLFVDRGADGCDVARLGADPGEPARELAKRLAAALRPVCVAPSLAAVAESGGCSRSYPDLDVFEEDALRDLLRLE